MLGKLDCEGAESNTGVVEMFSIFIGVVVTKVYTFVKSHKTLSKWEIFISVKHILILKGRECLKESK
jgi:hypothetical protein